jgi:hypothetical protein
MSLTTRVVPIKFGLNMDYDNPLICSGWNELKEFYRFQDDVVVEFSYFGKILSYLA